MIFFAASSVASATDIFFVSAFCIMFGITMFMISADCGNTGKGMPYGSMDVVTFRNRICSSRCFIHLVRKPRRLPGFEPTHAILVDHSGPVAKAMMALAAPRSRPPSTRSGRKTCAFDPPKTTARRAGPWGMSP